METLLKITLLVSVNLSVMAALAASLLSGLLRFYFDEEKMKWDASGSRDWALHQAEPMPNVFTPKEEQIWRARYVCVAVCVYLSAVMLLVIIVAAIAEVSLDLS